MDSGANMSSKCAILDGKYFSVVEENAGKVKGRCELCHPAKVTLISGSYSATTNFKTHIKRVHPGELATFEEYKIEWMAACRKRKRNKEKEHEPQLKQTNLTQMVKSKCNENRQTKFEDLLVKFVVNGMRPLTIVEDPDFVNLFEEMGFGVHVMSRRTLGRRIIETAEICGP